MGYFCRKHTHTHTHKREIKDKNKKGYLVRFPYQLPSASKIVRRTWLRILILLTVCVSKVQNSTQNLRGGGGGGSYHPVRPTVDEVNNKRPAGGARSFFFCYKRTFKCMLEYVPGQDRRRWPLPGNICQSSSVFELPWYVALITQSVRWSFFRLINHI